MKPAPFDYWTPDTLEQALALKAEHGDEARWLAGGQSLLPAMNLRLARPGVLIDLNPLAGLDTLEVASTGATRIAVACPFCYVMFDDGVKGEGKDEEVKVQDIAEILWEAIENESGSTAPVGGSFETGI